jgi:hypothetical protein
VKRASPLITISSLPLVGAVPDPDHTAHAWCGRICVPKFLHRSLKQALGGPIKWRAKRLRAFYAETLAAIAAAQPIGQEPVKFWRAAFAARFGTPAPAVGRRDITGSVCGHEPRCDRTQDCINRTLREARETRRTSG